MQISTDLRIRNFRWEDLPALTDLLNISTEYDQLEGRYTLDEMEHEWRQPEYDAETECYVVHNSEGDLIAYALSENPLELHHGYGQLTIHPDYRDSDLGDRLLQITDQRLLDAVKDEVPAEQPVYIDRWNSTKVPYYAEIYQRHGYTEARRFYTMRKALDTPIERPALPEGFTLRPFDPERDARAVWAGIEESFRDHWGHTDVPFDTWKRNRIDDPTFDPKLWYIAYEGDEVAGMSLCRRWGDDIPELAWVGSLGVRRPWRKRGLGMALLQYSFYDFQQQGYTLAGLGVDSSSKTNAVALYERAGMHVHRMGIVYRKVLQGDASAVPD